MTSFPAPIPASRFPCEGGVDVVPHVLPIRIPEEAYGMTVAEYFGLEDAAVACSGES